MEHSDFITRLLYVGERCSAEWEVVDNFLDIMWLPRVLNGADRIVLLVKDDVGSIAFQRLSATETRYFLWLHNGTFSERGFIEEALAAVLAEEFLERCGVPCVTTRTIIGQTPSDRKRS